MRTFLLRCAGFWGLQLALVAGLLSFHDGGDSKNFLAETVTKHQRLRTTPSPKIVLVGGSSLAVGVHSQQLEAAMGLPVVNMGLAAGLGLEFMLAEVAPHLRRGDTVIVSAEYDHFARGPESRWSGGRGFDPGILGQVLVFRPASVVFLGSAHLRSMLDRMLPLLSQVLWDSGADAAQALGWSKATIPESSQSRGFNAWSDCPLPNTLERAPGSLSLNLVADVRGFPNGRAIGVLSRFVTRMRARGVEVIWSYPPKPSEALNNPHLARFESALQGVPGLRLLDRPQDHGYPEDWFFDTANHLTSDGAEVRTQRWISQLKKRQ